MLVVRAIQATDLDALLDMASQVGSGMTTLKPDRKMLGDRLDLDDAALAWLADRGYDPAYGARPLKRVIQKELVDPIARKLLAGEIEDGGVIAVTAGEGGLEIGKARVH